jgi:hypothetical protein
MSAQSNNQQQIVNGEFVRTPSPLVAQQKHAQPNFHTQVFFAETYRTVIFAHAKLMHKFDRRELTESLL